MATATHAPYRALLARVRKGPDEAAAAAVTAFAEDINVRPPGEDAVLCIALARERSQTVAALGARRDHNPNIVDWFGVPMLCHLAGWCSNRVVITLLAHFPTLNVDVCDPAGCTPLHHAARNNDDTNVQLLLDAGADPTIRSLEGNTPAQLAWQSHGRFGFPRCTKLLETAEAWHAGLRRGWLRAVVGISKI